MGQIGPRLLQLVARTRKTKTMKHATAFLTVLAVSTSCAVVDALQAPERRAAETYQADQLEQTQLREQQAARDARQQTALAERQAAQDQRQAAWEEEQQAREKAVQLHYASKGLHREDVQTSKDGFGFETTITRLEDGALLHGARALQPLTYLLYVEVFQVCEGKTFHGELRVDLRGSPGSGNVAEFLILARSGLVEDCLDQWGAIGMDPRIKITTGKKAFKKWKAKTEPQDFLDSASPSRSCCKVCRSSKACGDSCISASKSCHQPVGCACDG